MKHLLAPILFLSIFALIFGTTEEDIYRLPHRDPDERGCFKASLVYPNSGKRTEWRKFRTFRQILQWEKTSKEGFALWFSCNKPGDIFTTSPEEIRE